MALGVSQEWDTYFTIQFLFIFLISFFYNTYSNAQATVVFLQNEYPDYLIEITNYDGLYLNDRDGQELLLSVYNENIGFKSSYASFIIKFLYFFLMPVSNFFFFFYLKNKPKSI